MNRGGWNGTCLAHRGSRLGRVFVAKASVLRVLTAGGMHLPGLPTVPERRPRTAWPDWVEMVPGQIYIYDSPSTTTRGPGKPVQTGRHHLPPPAPAATKITTTLNPPASQAGRWIRGYWLSTVLAPEETWVQVEIAFIAALDADTKGWLLQDPTLAEQLAYGQVPDNDDRVLALLAVSDNGPQLLSSNTAQFMAIVRIAQSFGRPGTPNDPAWIESFFCPMLMAGDTLPGECRLLSCIDGTPRIRQARWGGVLHAGTTSPGQRSEHLSCGDVGPPQLR